MKTRLGLLIGLLMAGLCAVSIHAGKPQPPTPPPGNPAIAYNINGDLWVADADGANPRMVIRRAGNVLNLAPKWSPFGMGLFFYGGPDRNPQQVYYTDLSGVYQPVGKINTTTILCISPVPLLVNGSESYMLIYCNPRDGFPYYDTDYNDIWLKALSGMKEPFNLTEATDPDNWPEIAAGFGPDGNRLLVRVQDPANPLIWKLQLYIYQLAYNSAIGRPTVSDRKLILELPENTSSYARWANTQDMAILQLHYPFDTQEIFILDLSTSKMVSILSSENMPGLTIGSPCWSPDDQHIIFSVLDTTTASGIYIIDRLSEDWGEWSSPRKLISGECRFPDWRRYAQ